MLSGPKYLLRLLQLILFLNVSTCTLLSSVYLSLLFLLGRLCYNFDSDAEHNTLGEKPFRSLRILAWHNSSYIEYRKLCLLLVGPFSFHSHKHQSVPTIELVILVFGNYQHILRFQACDNSRLYIGGRNTPVAAVQRCSRQGSSVELFADRKVIGKVGLLFVIATLRMQ